MPPLRWSVLMADLDPATGHEQAGRRPVLVFSNEAFNEATELLTVLPLTRLRQGRRPYPNEVTLPAGSAGQPFDSLVLTFQVRTTSRARTHALVGRLTDGELRMRIAEALLDHLDLTDLDLITDDP